MLFVPVRLCMPVGWLARNEVVVDHVGGESDHSDSEAGEHVTAGDVSDLYCVERRRRVAHRNIARFEKIGDFLQASRAAHGSRYIGPGILGAVERDVDGARRGVQVHRRGKEMPGVMSCGVAWFSFLPQLR